MIVPVICRNHQTENLETVPCSYDGALDAKTMEMVNGLFLEKAGSGYFYPLDPMDAYHDVWAELERKAANLPALKKASPHTYLSSVARLMFLNWFKRHVEPARRMYRQVEDTHCGDKGAIGVDDFDIDNYDATDEAPSSRMAAATDRGEGEHLCDEDDLSATSLGELLTATLRSSAQDRHTHETLETIFASLPGNVVKAFRAYIAANGCFAEAAHIARIPRTTFYRRWPAWIAAARRAAEALGMTPAQPFRR